MLKFPPTTKNIAIAFATLYILWGSTYLAIKFAIETIPPMIMISTRFLIAGVGMYIALVMSGKEHPNAKQWLSAVVTGVLLLGCGTGGLVIAEKTVPTGVASLLVAMVPVYIAIFEHLGKSMPSKRKLLGLSLGIIGILTLIGPANLLGHGALNLIGVATLMSGSFCWSLGSIVSRNAPKPKSTLMGTAMQMICGGLALGLAALIAGEHLHFSLQAVSMKSGLSFIYLIIFGSIFGFTSYIWLLEHVSPSKVATYAYVNPIVAVMLGCLFAGEAFTGQMATAAAIILTAVWLITTAEKSDARTAREKATSIFANQSPISGVSSQTKSLERDNRSLIAKGSSHMKPLGRDDMPENLQVLPVAAIAVKAKPDGSKAATSNRAR